MAEDIVEKLKPIIKDIVESNNLNLFDVEYLQEDGVWFLRVSIEKKDKTMDFATCEIISNLLSAKLDELDPIDHEYILETCSPGLERPLRNEKEFFEALNQYITVYLKGKLNKKDSFTGYLRKITDQDIEIEYKDKTKTKTILIKKDIISKAHLAVKF